MSGVFGRLWAKDPYWIPTSRFLSTFIFLYVCLPISQLPSIFESLFLGLLAHSLWNLLIFRGFLLDCIMPHWHFHACQIGVFVTFHNPLSCNQDLDRFVFDTVNEWLPRGIHMLRNEEKNTQKDEIQQVSLVSSCTFKIHSALLLPISSPPTPFPLHLAVAATVASVPTFTIIRSLATSEDLSTFSLWLSFSTTLNLWKEQIIVLNLYFSLSDLQMKSLNK